VVLSGPGWWMLCVLLGCGVEWGWWCVVLVLGGFCFLWGMGFPPCCRRCFPFWGFVWGVLAGLRILGCGVGLYLVWSVWPGVGCDVRDKKRKDKLKLGPCCCVFSCMVGIVGVLGCVGFCWGGLFWFMMGWWMGVLALWMFGYFVCLGGGVVVWCCVGGVGFGLSWGFCRGFFVEFVWERVGWIMRRLWICGN